MFKEISVPIYPEGTFERTSAFLVLNLSHAGNLPRVILNQIKAPPNITDFKF